MRHGSNPGAGLVFDWRRPLLGACFLGLKGYEYYDDWRAGADARESHFKTMLDGSSGAIAGEVPHVQVVSAAVLDHDRGSRRAYDHWHYGGADDCRSGSSRHFDAHYYGPIEVIGLYWHFVDVVWIFLLPLLYLLGTHHG